MGKSKLAQIEELVETCREDLKFEDVKILQMLANALAEKRQRKSAAA